MLEAEPLNASRLILEYSRQTSLATGLQVGRGRVGKVTFCGAILLSAVKVGGHSGVDGWLCVVICRVS